MRPATKDDAAGVFEKSEVKAGLRRLETSASRSSPPSTAPRSAVASRSPWPPTTASRPTPPRDRSPEVTLGLLPGGGGVDPHGADARHPGRADGGAPAGHPLQAGRGQGEGPRRRGRRRRRGVSRAAKAWILAHKDNEDARRSRGTATATRCPAAPRRTPASPQMLPGLPGAAAQADQGRRLPGPARRSWPPPSRVPRSTSTPPADRVALLHQPDHRPERRRT